MKIMPISQKKDKMKRTHNHCFLEMKHHPSSSPEQIQLQAFIYVNRFMSHAHTPFSNLLFIKENMHHSFKDLAYKNLE